MRQVEPRLRLLSCARHPAERHSWRPWLPTVRDQFAGEPRASGGHQGRSPDGGRSGNDEQADRRRRRPADSGRGAPPAAYSPEFRYSPLRFRGQGRSRLGHPEHQRLNPFRTSAQPKISTHASDCQHFRQCSRCARCAHEPCPAAPSARSPGTQRIDASECCAGRAPRDTLWLTTKVSSGLGRPEETSAPRSFRPGLGRCARLNRRSPPHSRSASVCTAARATDLVAPVSGGQTCSPSMPSSIRRRPSCAYSEARSHACSH